jgi:hypothetical protein
MLCSVANFLVHEQNKILTKICDTDRNISVPWNSYSRPVYFRGTDITGLYTSVALLFDACILPWHCYSMLVYFRGTDITGLYTSVALLFQACILPWH